MKTQREQIVQEIIRRLKAAGIGACAYRSRMVALSRDELPSVIVRPGQEQNEQTAAGLVKRTLQIIVEVHAASDSTPGAEVAADEAADPIVAAAHACLFSQPRTLGGLVAELFDREMQEPQFGDADETRVSITFIFEAVYMTSADDITKQATT